MEQIKNFQNMNQILTTDCSSCTIVRVRMVTLDVRCPKAQTLHSLIKIYLMRKHWRKKLFEHAIKSEVLYRKIFLFPTFFHDPTHCDHTRYVGVNPPKKIFLYYFLKPKLKTHSILFVCRVRLWEVCEKNTMCCIHKTRVAIWVMSNILYWIKQARAQSC